MNLLLDTHVLLWALGEPERLSDRVVAELAQEDTVRWLSPISAWEITMLEREGRIELGRSLDEWFSWARLELPIREAPITSGIAHVAGTVPGDPADAFLVATARGGKSQLVEAGPSVLPQVTEPSWVGSLGFLTQRFEASAVCLQFRRCLSHD